MSFARVLKKAENQEIFKYDIIKKSIVFKEMV